MLSIKDKYGREYQFEDHKEYNITLHAIREDRIIGSYKNDNDVIHVFTVSFDGSSQVWSQELITLTPYDELQDLKIAQSEGAIIEFNGVNRWKEGCDWTARRKDYRIKGGISIKAWNIHKDLIKQSWNGAKIEYLSKVSPIQWEDSEYNDWSIHYEYRVKQAKEMTIEEISKELGYDIKIVKCT